jgi:hypothetical protein
VALVDLKVAGVKLLVTAAVEGVAHGKVRLAHNQKGVAHIELKVTGAE